MNPRITREIYTQGGNLFDQLTGLDQQLKSPERNSLRKNTQEIRKPAAPPPDLFGTDLDYPRKRRLKSRRAGDGVKAGPAQIDAGSEASCIRYTVRFTPGCRSSQGTACKWSITLFC